MVFLKLYCYYYLKPSLKIYIDKFQIRTLIFINNNKYVSAKNNN